MTKMIKGEIMKPLTISMICLFFLAGCASLNITIDKDKQNFETLGQTIGAYMRIKHESAATKTIPWVEGVLSMTDEEFVEQDPITVGYTFLLNEFPDDAEMLMLVKATIDAFGISISHNLDGEIINKNEYIEVSRAMLKGYLRGVK
jgi:hypothetical protein